MGKSRPLFYILIIFLFFVSFLIFNHFRKDNVLINPSLLKTPLEKVVEKAMEGAKGNYAILIKNLKTGEKYIQNPDKIYEAGSLYKLWLMATVYEKIDKGEIKEDEILSQNVKVLHQEFGIGEDMAELAEGTVTLSVKDALHQMIAISHNYAALLLTEKIKLSTVAAYLIENGFNKSLVGTGGQAPVSNASDIALFLEKLYKGELVSADASQKMIELLKKQQLNDGLPKYLPEGTAVAHKTGDVGWFKHDAGIVFTDSGDYIIVVLSESNSPPGAQERIALVSKAVYDYFYGE